MRARKNAPDSFPELLSGNQFRELAGLSIAIWLELIELQKLPKPVVVGPRIKWRKADAIEWVRSLDPVDVFA